MAAKHIEPKTTKNKIDFLPQISDEDSSFRKDLSFLGALFLSLGIVVSESRETLALMKAFGYTDRECQGFATF